MQERGFICIRTLRDDTHYRFKTMFDGFNDKEIHRVSKSTSGKFSKLKRDWEEGIE